MKYVASLIENVIKSARGQSEFCYIHREKVLETPFDNHELGLLGDRDTKRLADKVDQEGVYHAYLWKYKRSEQTYKDFKDLYGIIDFLDFLLDDLLTVNTRILNNMWERKKQYQLSFKKAKEIMQTLHLIEEIEKEQPELLVQTRKQLELFGDVKGENIVQSYEFVVEPLKEFIVTKGKRHDKITELLFMLEDLSTQYTGIQLSAEKIASDYEYYGKHLAEKAGELEHMSKQIRNDYRGKIS